MGKKKACKCNELEELVFFQRNRIRELIAENDRLTLRYEPFCPEGDEDHGLDFYELVDENKRLKKDNATYGKYVNSLLAQLDQVGVDGKPVPRWRQRNFGLFGG